MALMATLILSAVLMMVMFSNTTSSFFARFDALGGEFKRVSLGLSEACTNMALLRISQDYDYAGDETVDVDLEECYIQTITYSDFTDDSDGNEISKKATIKTRAQYPENNGSWSTNKIVARVKNPKYTVVPPPTCSFDANTNSISSGQQVTFGWSIGGNANNFSVIRDIDGDEEEIFSDTTSPIEEDEVADSPEESATYTATVSGPGGETQCATPQSVVVQPALSCADTVMVLDRTGTIFNVGAQVPEKAAAKVLLNLYKSVVPTPKVGVVRFGDNTNGGVEAQVVPDGPDSGIDPDGWLSTNFGDDDAGNDTDGDLYNAVELALNTQSNVGTNVADAFNAAEDELNSTRHTAGKAKVMLIVSDGQPNEPPNGGGPSDSAREITLDAADAAKLSGIEIFTIHFGTDPAGFEGRELMAALASGVATTPSHGGHDGGSHTSGAIFEGNVAAENTDDDHFFISTSPSGADMPAVFDTIGKLACPASVPPPPPGPPPSPPPPPVAPAPLLIDSWDEVLSVEP